MNHDAKAREISPCEISTWNSGSTAYLTACAETGIHCPGCARAARIAAYGREVELETLERAAKATRDEIADAANADAEGAKDDHDIFGKPRFAFIWGFARGTEFMVRRIRALAAKEE